MRWLWEREDNPKRVWMEQQRTAAVYISYLLWMGKSIAKRDKDKLYSHLWDIMLVQLPANPYDLDN